MQYLYRNKAAIPLLIPGVGHPEGGAVFVSSKMLENPNFELVKSTEGQFSQEEITASQDNSTPSPTLPKSDEKPTSEARNDVPQKTDGVGEGSK